MSSGRRRWSTAGQEAAPGGRDRAGRVARVDRRSPARRRRPGRGGGRDRDRPRSVGAGVDRRRLHRVRGEPVAGGQVPGAAWHVRVEERPGDAHVLAELVRLDRAHHRPVAGDSDIAEHVKVLARTHQSMIWSRQRQANMLRSMLREFYPAALVAFGDDLTGRDALAVLAAAPSPEQGRRLTTARVVDGAAEGRPATQPPGRPPSGSWPRCAPSSWPPGRLWSAPTRPAPRRWSRCSTALVPAGRRCSPSRWVRVLAGTRTLRST